MGADDIASPDPIAVLMQEHRLIEQVLAALERCAGAVAAGGVRCDDLGDFVAFIREFADARHHRKEEDVLFAAMVDNGFPSDGGPIAVMLHEHEIGRSLVGELARIAESRDPWTDELGARLTATAREYAAFLRSHIAKEDEVLYPMARSVLPPAVMQDVATRCTALEREDVRRGEDARLRDLGADLVRRYPG